MKQGVDLAFVSSRQYGWNYALQSCSLEGYWTIMWAIPTISLSIPLLQEAFQSFDSVGWVFQRCFGLRKSCFWNHEIADL